MKNKIFTILFLFVAVSLHCQNRLISGIVLNANSGEKLVGATIYDILSNRGAISNKEGFYQLGVRKDTLLLRCSFVGYKADTVQIICQGDTIMNFHLEASTTFEEVVVTGLSKRNTNSHTLNYKQLTSVPSLGAEPDVLKSFLIFPGIQSSNEGSSDILVRGGGKGENLILIDNIPLYYVNHLGGFVSVFNPEIINHAEIVKGGFEPSYGGRLSSVLDITMKEGDKQKTFGSISMGIVYSTASFNGPISDKATYLFSLRRTFFDLFMRSFMPIVIENVSIGYYFYDFNGKISYKLSKKSTLHLSSYLGDDNLSFYYKNRKDKEFVTNRNVWGNILLSANLITIPNSRWYLRQDLYYTRYRTKDVYEVDIQQPETYEYSRVLLSGLRDLGYKFSANYMPSVHYSIEFGSDIVYHQYVPSEKIESQRATLGSLVSNEGFETSLHANNSFKIGDLIKLMAGVRVVYISGLHESANLFFEPRFSTILNVNESLSARLTYDKMHQYVHNLSSAGNMMNPDIWIPVSDKFVPSVAEQVSAGAEYYFSKNKLSLSISIYCKKYNNLVDYKAGELKLSGDTNWENRIESDGTGEAKGFEFQLQKSTAKISGVLAYTYSKSIRQFSGINNGFPFVSNYDRPHDASLYLNYIISDKLSINILGIFRSGLPVTLPLGTYSSLGIDGQFDEDQYEAFIYSKKNENRMRPYHRMDVGLIYKKERKGKDIRWNFSIYNVYNRFNPYYLFIDTDTNNNLLIKEQAFFSIIPSISYQIDF